MPLSWSYDIYDQSVIVRSVTGAFDVTSVVEDVGLTSSWEGVLMTGEAVMRFGSHYLSVRCGSNDQLCIMVFVILRY